MNYSLLLVDLLLIVLSIGFLWKGSDWLVTSASNIAHTWGVSDLVIGLTVVAIGTSAPEFAVTISAVVMGKTDISVSNIIGSNIFNLGFILGGTAAIRGLATTPKLVYRDGFFLIGVTILLGLCIFGFQLFLFNQPTSGSLNWIEGGVLMSLLVCYVTFLLIKKEPLDEDISHDSISWKDWAKLLIGIAGVVGGGHLLVESASGIAKMFGVSDWVIGVTIVAAGTSAPELATSIMAVLKGRQGMAIGNLIGSDLFNLLGVLGLAAILKGDLPVSPDGKSSVIMLITMVIVVVFFMRTNWRVSRTQGAFLVMVNLARWIYDFGGKLH